LLPLINGGGGGGAETKELIMMKIRVEKTKHYKNKRERGTDSLLASSKDINYSYRV